MCYMKDEFDFVYVVNTSTGPVDVCDSYDLACRVRAHFVDNGFLDVKVLSFRLRYDKD